MGARKYSRLARSGKQGSQTGSPRVRSRISARSAPCRAQFEDARDLVDQALAIYEELGLTFRSTVTLGYHSASVHQLNGDMAAAEGDLRKAIGLFEKMGDRTARSTVTAYLATVLYDRGHYEEAERQAVLSEELAGMDDDYATITHARSVRAKNLARRGEFERAKR